MGLWVSVVFRFKIYREWWAMDVWMSCGSASVVRCEYGDINVWMLQVVCVNEGVDVSSGRSWCRA